MRVILPVIDTDPNSGTSFGAMPVWVVLTASSTIRQIHTLALTYNANFGTSASYQYFHFPKPDTRVLARLGMSQRFDREAVAEYTTEHFLDQSLSLDSHVEFSKDSSKRFFGIGPNTPVSHESNYTMDTINYRVSAGVPLREGSPLRAALTNQFQANDLSNGGIESIPDLERIHPTTADELDERHRDFSLLGRLEYDSRDSPITTSQGSYADAFLEGAHKDVIGEYSYVRYGTDLKTFLPVYAADDAEPRTITALRLKFENIHGGVPFWLLSSLGGKYSHRAYGEGRFIDHSVIIFGGEQRTRLYAAKVQGTTASFWLDPFFAFGTVSPRPQLMQWKYLRPVFGAALRVVCRPNVVGSADFGVGQEGLKVFLDINYTF